MAKATAAATEDIGQKIEEIPVDRASRRDRLLSAHGNAMGLLRSKPKALPGRPMLAPSLEGTGLVRVPLQGGCFWGSLSHGVAMGCE